MFALQLGPAEQNFNEIHDEAMIVAKDIKDNYQRFFEVLLKVEGRRIYEQFEVPSLYLYCVELLELSPQIAKDFICVVRKSFEVPELAAAVRSKKLTISKARKICPVLDSSNSKEWIELAKSCSCRTIERAVAMANPKAGVEESIRHVGVDAIEFKIGVSEEWIQLLDKTKDLVSQKRKRAVRSEEALLLLMSDFCKKNDPLEKAERAKRRLAEHVHAPNESRLAKRTRHIPSSIMHSVNFRDQAQCSFVDRNGKRCQSKRWLEVHHIQEFSLGGDHKLENLETLCSAHHKIKHRKIAASQS